MEEFGPPESSSGRSGMSRVGSSHSISTRNRRGGMGSPRKSMSIDSSLNSYSNQHPSNIPTGGNINGLGVVGDAIQADTPLPQNQSSYPLVPSNGHHIQMYDDGQPVRESGGSANGSPSKRVAFKGVPMIDHETPRMLNGTPHHKPYPRMADLALAGDDEVLAIDTESRSFGQPIMTAANSFPALTHHNVETALEPYTGMAPISSSSIGVPHASHHIGIPNTSSMRALTNEKKSIMTASSSSSTVALTNSAPSAPDPSSSSTALPPIDYVPTQQQQQFTIQRQFNLTRDQEMQNYHYQQQYVMSQQHHLQQIHQQQQLNGEGKRTTVLPAIPQNTNPHGKTDIVTGNWIFKNTGISYNYYKKTKYIYINSYYMHIF